MAVLLTVLFKTLFHKTSIHAGCSLICGPRQRTIKNIRKPLCFLAITPTARVGVFVSGRFLMVGELPCSCLRQAAERA
jgi:hypothetical protein